VLRLGLLNAGLAAFKLDKKRMSNGHWTFAS
jgi:hypothetical protein